MPKVVIAVVPGWAVGGGHSLHVTCDLTLASKEHAVFKQTDADVASFDGGYGSAYLARQCGQKFAREIFFLGENYSADEAYHMGMVNRSVPHENLEKEAIRWAKLVNEKSPTAQRMLKYAFNLPDGSGWSAAICWRSNKASLWYRRSHGRKRFIPRKKRQEF